VTGTPTVDVHTHLAPALDRAVSGVEEAGRRYVVDGHRVGLPGLYDAAGLVDWLTSVQVERAWVSLPPPFFRQGQDAGATAAWVTAANDGLLARIAGHPQLEELAYLPLDRPEVALDEVDRRAGTVTGWAGSAGGGSLPLDDPRLTPLWARLESAGRPLLLHPGSSPDTRLDPHYLSNLLGNPMETTVAAAELVFGDVLGAHPGLRVLLVHCGGGVPLLAGRWQRGAGHPPSRGRRAVAGPPRGRPPVLGGRARARPRSRRPGVGRHRRGEARARQRLAVPHGVGRPLDSGGPPPGRPARTGRAG